MESFSGFFPVWDKLSDAQRLSLQSSVVLRHFEKGSTIHSGSDDCIDLLVVKSGQIRVYTLSDEGKELTLYRLLPHDMCLFSASCVMPSILFDVMVSAELAGPANKQGRIAADNIAGMDARYRGTQGSSIAKVFDLTAASTGATEKTLTSRGMEKGKDYETMFFTFWGLTALRKDVKLPVKKSFMESMFGAMLPRGSKKLKLSRMNMGGMGTVMMKKIMDDKNVDSLEALIQKAIKNGVKIVACTMSMDVMGIRSEELIDGVELAGVGAYLGDAEELNVNLFI